MLSWSETNPEVVNANAHLFSACIKALTSSKPTAISISGFSGQCHVLSVNHTTRGSTMAELAATGSPNPVVPLERELCKKAPCDALGPNHGLYQILSKASNRFATVPISIEGAMFQCYVLSLATDPTGECVAVGLHAARDPVNLESPNVLRVPPVTRQKRLAKAAIALESAMRLFKTSYGLSTEELSLLLACETADLARQVLQQE